MEKLVFCVQNYVLKELYFKNVFYNIFYFYYNECFCQVQLNLNLSF